jgi:hypothetical protein
VGPLIFFLLLPFSFLPLAPLSSPAGSSFAAASPRRPHHLPASRAANELPAASRRPLPLVRARRRSSPAAAHTREAEPARGGARTRGGARPHQARPRVVTVRPVRRRRMGSALVRIYVVEGGEWARRAAVVAPAAGSEHCLEVEEDPGQNSHFHMWVPHVRWVQPSSSNKIHPKWHVRQRTLSAWHTSAWELFRDMYVIGNFSNGMYVNDSKKVDRYIVVVGLLGAGSLLC